LKLSKIGGIRIKLHRPIEGEIKTCTLSKTVSGEWDVSFSCEVKTKPLPVNAKSVGIDVGIENFATLSNGNSIENPRFFKTAEKKLASAQRKLSKEKKGTRKRHKLGKVVAKIHEKIRNRRKDFCHKVANKIVKQNQYIFVEDLQIQKMMQKSFLAKSIADVGWNQFRQFLTYKAEEAGRVMKVVNPAYTSQTCNRCQHREAKKLSEREHNCKKCGYRATRDCNAAENILALGLDGLGMNPRSLRL